MKHCDKCSVSVRGNETICPLCQNKLAGSDREEIYPKIPTVYKQFNVYFQLLAVFTIMGCVSCVAINILLPQSGFWSVLVLLGTVSFWITLANAVRRKDNIAKDITIWVFIISLLSIVWDWSTGWHGWSINFSFPIAWSMAMVSLTIIARVMKLRGEDYIMYLVADTIFGAAPIIFYATGLISVMIPSVICMALSIVSILTLIISEGKNIVDEIKKTFHF